MRKAAHLKWLSPGEGFVANTWTAFSNTERAVLTLCCIVCGLACLWTGSLLGIPREPGFNGSLLASPAPVSGVIVVAVSVAICAVIGSLVAAFIETEAGLFCCCVGLAALGIHSGPIRPVLQFATGPHVFVLLSIETALLGAILCAVWFVLQKIFDRPELLQASQMKTVAPNEVTDATLSQKLLTLLVQMAVMCTCELILIQTDAKAQAMAGVSLAAFVGVLAAYMFTPMPQGIWYWTGPMILGTFGFLLAYFNAGTLASGDLYGWSAALARPTPLDYAGMGTAGALLAYWCSRRWAQPEEVEAESVVQ